MNYPHFDLVQKAEADLKAEGLIQPRGNQDAVEQDKGLLTRRAAWYINQQRDPRIGLLEKTSGNNSLGYSVDWHVLVTDGRGWDVATDENGMAKAVNGDEHPPDPDAQSRWRPPTAELAQMPEDGGGTEPVPPPDGGNSTDERLAAIEAALETLVGLVGKQGEEIYHMRTQTWAGDAALALRMHFGLKCPPMPDDAQG